MLPCVGVIRLPLADHARVWPAVIDLWLDFLDDAIPSARDWVSFATRVVRPDSILAERLREWQAPTSTAPPDLQTQQIIDTLHELCAQRDPAEEILEEQARILRQALGGRGPG